MPPAASKRGSRSRAAAAADSAAAARSASSSGGGSDVSRTDAGGDGDAHALIAVPDPDFHQFDAARTEADLKAGEVWAMYDEKDGMPRYYVRITGVRLEPAFEVRYQWLDSCGTPPEARLWSRTTGFAIAAGEFKEVQPGVSTIINAFSHRAQVTEPAARGHLRGPRTLKIWPRKGDVWAMYSNWAEVQAIDRAAEVTFDLVEVLDDFGKDSGVATNGLAKLDGFQSVFVRGDRPRKTWKASELVRFSHYVPAVKLPPNDSAGIPEHAWELDPAALPPEKGAAGEEGSDAMEVATPPPAPATRRSRRRSAQKVEEKSPVEEESPDTSKNEEDVADADTEMNMEEEVVVKEVIKEKVVKEKVVVVEQVRPRRKGRDKRKGKEPVRSPSPEEVEDEDEEEVCAPSSPLLEEDTPLSEVEFTDFYDFGELRTREDVQEGQVWAVYDEADAMPRVYVRVAGVRDSSPFRAEVVPLKPNPCAPAARSWMDRTGLSLAFGEFRNGKRHELPLRAFSHPIMKSDEEVVQIYPKKGEVWAMFRDREQPQRVRRQQAGHDGEGEGDAGPIAYDLVEISDVGLDEAGKCVELLFVRLDKVPNFKALYTRVGEMVSLEVVIPDSIFEFSHNVPAVRMFYDEANRIPARSHEVDPAALPRK